MGLFAKPAFLFWAAAALAGAWALGAFGERRRRKVLEAFAGTEVLSRLYPLEADAARILRWRLRTAALFLMLLALAAPQWGVELVTTQAKTSQVFIAVDVSSSMLAEDLKPNRMQKAKNTLGLLIDGLKGERVGLIAFAGEAFVQCPLTTDRAAAKSLLRRMAPGMVRQQGTNLTKAVSLAADMLNRYPGQKGIVLLTDGESHDGQALESVKAAAEAGIRLFIIGMGTPEGEPIPVKDMEGRTIGYKKDRTGKTVVSRLAERELIELAAASGGAYYRATTDDGEVAAVINHIADMDKGAGPAGSRTRYKNRFRLPLVLAFLLLLLDLVWPDRRGLGSVSRFAAPASAASSGRASGALKALMVAGAALFLSACSMPSDLQLIFGNSDYHDEDYGGALKRYEKADRRDARTPFNTGAALYKMGDYESAKETFQMLADPARVPKGMAPKSYYNLGNALFRKDMLPEAAEAYKRCLMLDPSDEDCRHNLLLALRPPKQDDKKDKKKEDEKKDQDKKDQDKKDQDKPQGGGSPQSRDRQQSLSREEANRILQAVQEKEQSALQRQPLQQHEAPPAGAQTKEDW